MRTFAFYDHHHNISCVRSTMCAFRLRRRWRDLFSNWLISGAVMCCIVIACWAATVSKKDCLPLFRALQFSMRVMCALRGYTRFNSKLHSPIKRSDNDKHENNENFPQNIWCVLQLPPTPLSPPPQPEFILFAHAMRPAIIIFFHCLTIFCFALLCFIVCSARLSHFWY